MPRSQNGWSANDRSVISTRRVPGTYVNLAVRDGDAGDVLLYVMSQFDRRVEDIDNARGALDDWGYAERPIRGSATTLSNHASGTAVDANATAHPLGAVGTFSKEQVREIHRILDEVDRVVRWGGDYKGRKDEMHFEIIGSVAAVQAVARKLPTLGKEVDFMDVYVVKYGDGREKKNGDPRVARAMRVVQAAGQAKLGVDLLPKYGIDGKYGDEFRDAINAMSKKAQLPQEGKTGLDVLLLDYCRALIHPNQD